MIQINTGVSAELLNACISQLEKGLAVELLLSNKNQAWLEGNPFLLNKCVQLVKKGGAVFLAARGNEIEAYRCILDFAETLEVVSPDTMHCSQENNPAEVQAYVKEFNRIKGECKPYLVEHGDIQLNLTVSEQVVLKGDVVEIGWEVDLADKIVLQGVGTVKDYDTKKVSIQQSTIIKIGAYNSRQSQIRAVKIWVSEEVKISYDIGFLGKQTHAYYSLVHAENYPHVYGVAHGNEVRLTWQVLDANEVTVYPFGDKRQEGEHVFTPLESTTIEIQAKVQGRVITRKIALLVFPLPVFKDKLIPLMKSNNYRYQFTISGETQLSLKTHAQVTRKEAAQRYAQLCSTVNKHSKDIQSKTFSLNRINTILFGFLRRKHAQKAGVIRALQSIQEYYTTPKHE